MFSSLYIHIPFCKRLCGYCDFYKTMSLSRMDEVLDAMAQEMTRRRALLDGTILHTIYFGGGTPSLVPAGRIGGLIDAARSTWDCSSVSEITVEANPDDLTPAYLDALRATGCNRLSIGIQSFIDHDLQTMNRRHNSLQAVEAVKNARTAGFDNISVDLIYGLPEQSIEEWRSNVCRAIDMGVEHLSAYHLSIEPGTLFFRRNVQTAPENTGAAEYDILCREMDAAGYSHYEISNFARDGFRSLHNSAYWTGRPYLGIGPSAHSYDGDKVRSWNVPSVGLYLSGEGIGSETLSPQELYEDFVMVRLRTAEGVPLDELEQRFGKRKLSQFLSRAEIYFSHEILVRDAACVRFNPAHWLVSNGVIGDFF